MSHVLYIYCPLGLYQYNKPPFVTWNQSSRLCRSGAATLVAAALPLGASILLLGAASSSPKSIFSPSRSVVRCSSRAEQAALTFFFSPSGHRRGLRRRPAASLDRAAVQIRSAWIDRRARSSSGVGSGEIRCCSASRGAARRGLLVGAGFARHGSVAGPSVRAPSARASACLRPPTRPCASAPVRGRSSTCYRPSEVLQRHERPRLWRLHRLPWPRRPSPRQRLRPCPLRQARPCLQLRQARLLIVGCAASPAPFVARIGIDGVLLPHLRQGR